MMGYIFMKEMWYIFEIVDNKDKQRYISHMHKKVDFLFFLLISHTHKST